MNKFRAKIIWATLFALSMGYFEAAIVEYLRELFYPQGFAFPLKDIPPTLLTIEWGRELISILMLLSVAVLVGSSPIDRFAGFAYCFGVWDITYYIFLYLFERWPSSLGTTDVLFLIPVPWIGPVWAPIAVSLGLMGASMLIWRRLERGVSLKPTMVEWIGEIIAGLLIIGSFCAGAPAAIEKRPLPPFPWYLWLVGMAMGIMLFLRAFNRRDPKGEDQ